MSAASGAKVAPWPTNAGRDRKPTCPVEVQQGVLLQTKSPSPSPLPSPPVQPAPRRLPLTAPPEGLLRAATLSEVTARFSDCFHEPTRWDDDTEQLMASCWDRSHGVQPVEDGSRRPIDYFVSHAWSDGRLLKFLTLSIWFNNAAFLFSLAIGLCLATAWCLWVHHLHPIAIFTVYLTAHYAFFLHWRSPALWLRELLSYKPKSATARQGVAEHSSLIDCLAPTFRSREPTFFVDRLCVHQTDDDKRNQAIEGLAGILSQCDSFIALWSDDYSSRLWCTFEVAVFLGVVADTSKIKFVPIKFGALVLFLDVVVNLGNIVYFAGAQNRLTDVRSAAIRTVFASLAYVVIWRVARCNVTEIVSAQTRIKTFDIHRTACAVEADRPVLFNTLQHLFGERYLNGAGGFFPWDVVVNEVIRTRAMLETHPLSLFRYRFTLSIACTTLMRYVCIIIASFAATGLSESDREQVPTMVTFALLHAMAQAFCTVPCIVYFVLLACNYTIPLYKTQPCDGWLLDIISGLLMRIFIYVSAHVTLLLPSRYVFGKPNLADALEVVDGFVLNYRVRGGAAEVVFRLCLLLAHVLFTVWLVRKCNNWNRLTAQGSVTANVNSHFLRVDLLLEQLTTTNPTKSNAAQTIKPAILNTPQAANFADSLSRDRKSLPPSDRTCDSA